MDTSLPTGKASLPGGSTDEIYGISERLVGQQCDSGMRGGSSTGYGIEVPRRDKPLVFTNTREEPR